MSAEQDLANANVQISNLISEVTRFRDAAMGINNIWPTITEGRQNTADGKYFSVPGNGKYMTLYRRAGSSQTVVAEFPDRAQVQSLVDTLGGRGVVGGSGDLMALGAIGLGLTSTPGNTQGLDFDNYTTPDVYSVFSNSAGGFANAPLPYLSTTLYGGLIVTGEVESRLQQIYHSRRLNDNRMFCRSCNNGVWSTTWAEIYNSGSILGTVSRAGGTPTGGVIERGSNGFGKWTKFANGLRIQHTVRLSVDMSVAGSINNNYTLPQSVSVDATVAISAESFAPGINSFTRTAMRAIGGTLLVRFLEKDGDGSADAGFYATITDYWY